MQAVILAAGVGSRLSAATAGLPKCLVDVGGATLLEHHLRALERVGVTELVAVLGHRHQEVAAALHGRHCTIVVNERYAETNSLFSMNMARPHIHGDTLVLNADVLAHPAVYERLVSHDGTGLVYDTTSGQDAEHMKVRVVDGAVRAMSKTLPSELVAGENLGMLRISRNDTNAFFDAAKAIIAAKDGQRAWAPAAVDRLCSDRRVDAIDVADLPWVEIDFPQDLAHARNHTWPAICGRTPRSAMGST